MPDVKLDSMADIAKMANANNLVAIRTAIANTSEQAGSDPQQAELVKGFEPVLKVVEDRIAELGEVKTALADISSVIPNTHIENLDQIRAVQNTDNLEVLKNALSQVIASAEKEGGAALDAVKGHRRVLEVVNQTLSKRA